MTRLTTSITPGDLTSNSSTALWELGCLAETPDGRRFRYCKAGAVAIVAGRLYQGTAETTAWQNLTLPTTAAGATSITTTSTITATKDQLAGGYLVITTGTGSGYTYKIKSNTAASSAACTLTLEEPLVAALSSAYGDIVKDPYNYVELWDYTNHDAIPVGVGVYPVTATYYGWLQVGGPCGLLIDSGNIGVGANVYASAAVDGCGDATSTYGFIGTAMTGGSSTEVSMVNLNIN